MALSMKPSEKLICPSCKKPNLVYDPITGIYFCKSCGYQGTFVIISSKE
ncbi:hypothetical protein J4467_00805 [Candidatus Woesearchaeota archaeon]|nr:hypothetical protein [Candidatus Woesearchaeota archaeon]